MSVSTLVLRRKRPWLPRALPFACYISFLVATPFFSHLLPDARWVYGIQIVCVALLLALFAHRYEELWRVPRMSLLDLSIAVMVGALVFVLWINLDRAPFAFSGGAGFDPRADDGRIVWPLALMRSAGATLVVPVMEELFWRSLVMRRLDGPDFLALHPRACSAMAWIGSSVVFGFEHTLWFAGIVAGAAYAWLYRRDGNLWSAIVAHAITNLMLAIWVLRTANWQFW